MHEGSEGSAWAGSGDTHTALGVRSKSFTGGTLLGATFPWVINDGTKLLNHLDPPLNLLLKVSEHNQQTQNRYTHFVP